MATANIYHEENNTNYTVVFNVESGILDDASAGFDYYLKITTTIKMPDGTGFGEILVRTLSDVPQDGGAATSANFTTLCNRWIQYFLTTAGFGASSSSSSTSSSSSSGGYSSSSSSSSSSEGYSSSSSSSSSEGYSSSSSSSEGYSSSSSSSEGYSSSSSSEGYSSSSSSSSSSGV